MAPRKTVAPAPDASVVNFDSLEADDYEGPLPQHKLGREAVPIPDSILNAVKASEQGVKRFPVTPANVKALDGMIRRAAHSLGRGMKIRYLDANGEPTVVNLKSPEGMTATHLLFRASDPRATSDIPRRPREPKQKTGESEASFRARQVGYERKLIDWETNYG